MGRDQLFIKRVEGFREDARAGEHGHEIVVAFPPRHDVQMKVIGDPGAGALPEIQADVEALRLDRVTQQALGVFREFPQFQFFAVGQRAQIGHFAIRHDHHVPDRVRVAVHDQESVLAARDDEMRGIVAGLRGFEEEVGCRADREVFGAPGSQRAESSLRSMRVGCREGWRRRLVIVIVILILILIASAIPVPGFGADYDYD